MPTKEIVLRRATLEDSAALAEIENEHIAKGGSSMVTALRTPDYYKNVIANFNDRELIDCLVVNHQIIGLGIIKKYSDREGYSTTCETAIYLKSSYLRQGLGTKMKLHLIELCRSMKYHHLVAKIFSTNKASIAYNQQLGYEVVGVQKEVGKINGKWVDVTIMQLIL